MENTKMTKGQKTAKQILEAAARCIQKVGAEKTSVTNIALEANLKRSLIAYHFPKKAEIFFNVILHIMEEIEALRNQKIEGLKGARRLESLMDTYLSFFYEQEHYFNCFLHFHYLASIDEKYKNLCTRLTDIGHQQISICLTELLEEQQVLIREKLVTEFSELLYHSLIGAIMRYYTVNNHGGHQQFQQVFMHSLSRQIDLFLYYAQKTKELD